MDIDLARRWMLENLPPDAHQTVNDVFLAMKANPLAVLNNSLVLSQIAQFKSENKALAVASVNGFISGFALANCLEAPEVVKIIQESLERKARARGENVVGFLARKGK